MDILRSLRRHAQGAFEAERRFSLGALGRPIGEHLTCSLSEMRQIVASPPPSSWNFIVTFRLCLEELHLEQKDLMDHRHALSPTFSETLDECLLKLVTDMASTQKLLKRTVGAPLETKTRVSLEEVQRLVRSVEEGARLREVTYHWEEGDGYCFTEWEGASRIAISRKGHRMTYPSRKACMLCEPADSQNNSVARAQCDADLGRPCTRCTQARINCVTLPTLRGIGSDSRRKV